MLGIWHTCIRLAGYRKQYSTSGNDLAGSHNLKLELAFARLDMYIRTTLAHVSRRRQAEEFYYSAAHNSKPLERTNLLLLERGNNTEKKNTR